MIAHSICYVVIMTDAESTFPFCHALFLPPVIIVVVVVLLMVSVDLFKQRGKSQAGEVNRKDWRSRPA